jgi:lycopene beta-cyclase
MNTNNRQIDANQAIYDFVFIGLGASNSLLLKSISEQPTLCNKKIAIIESDNKNTNDKTYCFWANPNDPIITELAALIRYKYDSIVINRLSKQQINDQPYHYISSIDLYANTAQLVQRHQYPIYRHKVEQIESHDGIQAIHTNQGTIQSYFIFDSRPPAYKDLLKRDVYLHQSFYGLHIKFEKDVFNENSFEMMNFNVDQNAFTQFIYILPFSKREALIELTRFGSEKIDIDYAKTILSEKINKDFGRYEVVADESGCIPMTTFLHPTNEIPGILNTGSRANLIKPSTGYGFKNMFAFSKLITTNLLKGDLENFNQIALKSKPRFKFYDHLLLIILLKWPHLGKLIFSTLFKKQNIKTVFAFLDEKTSLFQEIKIFAKLPFKPFLHATLIYFWKFIQPRYFYASLLVLTYLMLNMFNETLAKYFAYVITIFGMLLVGIPHGAVDQYLQGAKDKKQHTLFILKYLVLIGLFYLLWQILPLLSFVFFILYSAFHFGESELEDANVSLDSIRNKFNAFLLGLSILVLIVFTHLTESQMIILKMTQTQIFRFGASSQYIGITVSLTTLLFVMFRYNMLSKNKAIGIITLLLLGVLTPLEFAFALYFIGQHSFNAWQHIKIRLTLGSFALYKKALPYTLGAFLIFLFMLIYSNELLSLNKNYLAHFFIFLACISCPHFIFMHLFYKNKNV